MHASLKSFTRDIETRLDKAYRNGASEKFGIDEVRSERSISANSERSNKSKKSFVNKYANLIKEV